MSFILCLLLQLLLNFLGFKFLPQKIARYYRIVALVIFPLLMIATVFFGILIAMLDYEGAPDAVAVSFGDNYLILFLFFILFSFGLQIMINRYWRRKMSVL